MPLTLSVMALELSVVGSNSRPPSLSVCVLRAEVAHRVDALDFPIPSIIDTDQDLTPARRRSNLLPYKFR